jgi:O-antigen/teichoic acid export membrane protein
VDDAPAGAVLARNVFHLVLGQVTTTILAVTFNGVLGRFLGAADFGLCFVVMSFGNFAFTFADWGQQYYGIREVARNPHRGGELLGTGLILRATGILLVTLPCWLATKALRYDLRTQALCVAYLVASLPLLLAQLYGIVFRGRDRMGLDASVSVINRVFLLLLSLVALRAGLGLNGVLLAYGGAGVLALVAAAFLYRRVATGPVRFAPSTARELLAGGTALAAMNLAIFVQPYIDTVLVSKLVTAEAIGWFGAARNIMGTLFAPVSILSGAAYPRLSRAARSPDVFRQELGTALRPILWVGALAAVGTYLFADLGVHIVYGHRHFGPAAAILRVFAAGLFLFFLDGMFGIALNAVGRAGAFSAVKIASVAVSTGLDFLLIPYFQRTTGNGGIGAVVAFVGSELVVFAGVLAILPRRSVAMGTVLDAGRAVLAAGLTVAAFTRLQWLSPWAGVPLCIAAFSALSVAVGLVRRADLDRLRAIVARKLGAALPSETAE